MELYYTGTPKRRAYALAGLLSFSWKLVSTAMPSGLLLPTAVPAHSLTCLKMPDSPAMRKPPNLTHPLNPRK